MKDCWCTFNIVVKIRHTIQKKELGQFQNWHSPIKIMEWANRSFPKLRLLLTYH